MGEPYGPPCKQQLMGVMRVEIGCFIRVVGQDRKFAPLAPEKLWSFSSLKSGETFSVKSLSTLGIYYAQTFRYGRFQAGLKILQCFCSEFWVLAQCKLIVI